MTYTPPAAGQRITDEMLEEMVGKWEDYVVAWTSAGTAPAVGSDGSLTGRFCIIGDTVLFSIKLIGGAATTWGTGNYSFSLPVAAAATADHIGTCFVGDSSAGAAAYSQGIAFMGGSSTTVQGYVGNKNGTSSLSNTNPQTMASGDRIWLHGSYEMA